MKNTNVIELYHLLDKDDDQLTFYNSGIGTYATPSWKSWDYWKQQIGHKLDLAIAWCVFSCLSLNTSQGNYSHAQELRKNCSDCLSMAFRAIPPWRQDLFVRYGASF